MRETLVWHRQLWSLVIGLSFSPALAASEAASTPPPPVARRTSAPGCAKIVCQRGAAAVDAGASAERAPGAQPPSPFSLRFGAGAGAFRGPAPDSGVYPTKLAFDGTPIYGTERAKIAGAALSLGVSLEQELSSAALHWGLEERFALTTVLALDRGSSIGGLLDVLVSARAGSLPLRLAFGPSLSVVQLDVSDESTSLPEPVVLVSGAASLRWDPQALPVAFDLTAHLGKSLDLDGGGSYRELQLTLLVPL
jgi:hypothetical protein